MHLHIAKPSPSVPEMQFSATLHLPANGVCVRSMQTSTPEATSMSCFPDTPGRSKYSIYR